jgi:hypothetical protein
MRSFAAFAIMLYASTCFASEADDYKEYGREVAQVISKMKTVAETPRERNDLRALEFLLRDYNKHVSQKNWRQADLVRDKMSVPLSRGGVVASNANKRLQDRERAEANRRHQEAMRQRERQHQEAMRKQDAILNQMRTNQYYQSRWGR